MKIYSQPSIKKKVMEKHIIKSMPTGIQKLNDNSKSIIKTADYNTKKPINISSAAFNIGCPISTIPMKKLAIEDLKRFETIEDYNSKYPYYKKNAKKSPDYEVPAVDSGTHEYANVIGYNDNWGASSTINVWNSYTEQSSEFSLSQIWVARGNTFDGSLETVEAGAQVYNNRNGDNNNHFFIYFTPDNYGSGGCYDLGCGFVQTNPNILIGQTLTPVSTLGGTQYSIHLEIVRDTVDGDWWIKYGDSWLGYYPNSLFDSNGLKDKAARADFGGEIFNGSISIHTNTDMGSGEFPSAGWQQAAFQNNLKYVDLNYTYVDLTNGVLNVTDSNCYDINYISSSSGT